MSYPMIILAFISLLVIGIATWAVTPHTGTGRSLAGDYRIFYILGVTWLSLGVTLSIALKQAEFWGMGIVGLIFTLIGLMNLNKWR